uniref:7TM_GPCR_Srx domain-containing protein n=1 Tax=Caenorhabditis tropicalis TaxID=1561998 RepID=A0A1I7THY2_9PELO
MSNCTASFLLAYNPIYRTSSIYQMVISIGSIVPLGYFLGFKLLKSSFHLNLKFIFIGYFVSMILFSAIYAGTATTQAIIALISYTECDVIIPSVPHKYLLTTISFLLTLSTLFPISITIERYYAMKNAEKYEKMKMILGPCLVGINILLNFCVIFNIFHRESFSDPSVSFSVYPAVAAQKVGSLAASKYPFFQIFTVFLILFCLNLIDVLFDFILLRQNISLKKKLKNSSLTTKYQLEEVYQSTKFSLFIVFIHIFSFGLYVSAVVFFRYLGGLVVSNGNHLFGIRTFASTMIPTYHLILGIISIIVFNRIKSKKSEGTTIQMSSTGNSGANNYDQAIFSIWNSHSNVVVI